MSRPPLASVVLVGAVAFVAAGLALGVTAADFCVDDASAASRVARERLRAPAPQVDRSLAFSRTRRVVKSVGRQPFHAP